MQILMDLYAKSMAHFKSNRTQATDFIEIGDAPVPPNERAVKLAAMSNVARAILSLHEVITRD